MGRSHVQGGAGHLQHLHGVQSRGAALQGRCSTSMLGGVCVGGSWRAGFALFSPSWSRGGEEGGQGSSQGSTAHLALLLGGHAGHLQGSCLFDQRQEGSCAAAGAVARRRRRRCVGVALRRGQAAAGEGWARSKAVDGSMLAHLLHPGQTLGPLTIPGQASPRPAGHGGGWVLPRPAKKRPPCPTSRQLLTHPALHRPACHPCAEEWQQMPCTEQRLPC